jgi:hypothetical protein
MKQSEKAKNSCIAGSISSHHRKETKLQPSFGGRKQLHSRVSPHGKRHQLYLEGGINNIQEPQAKSSILPFWKLINTLELQQKTQVSHEISPINITREYLPN